MKQRHFLWFLALLLAALMLCPGCGSNARAAVMRLAKTEGPAGVADGDGNVLALKENMGLYSGYQLGTGEAGYAWVELDSTKLAKLDQESWAAIERDGSALEIVVHSGSLFFNITEPLSEDETLDIRTSTMMAGIRGTCGWVEVPDTEHMNIYILEGRVECSAGDGNAFVNAGEMAMMDTSGRISVQPFDLPAIPAFVQDELDNGALDARAEHTADGDTQSPAAPTTTVTLPISVQELNELLDTDGVETVVVQPGGGSGTLEVNSDCSLHVPKGKTLDLEAGVTLQIKSGALYNDGTLLAAGTLTNSDSGLLINSGVIRAAGGIDSQGSLSSNNGVIDCAITQTGGSLYLDGGSVNSCILTNTDTDIRNCSTGGITQTGGTLDITNGSVQSVTIDNATLNIGDNALSGSAIGNITQIDGHTTLSDGAAAGAITVYAGQVYVSGGSTAGITINGGEVLIAANAAVGSITQNGGELTDLR